ncbi:MAG: NAD-dependent epimerase/dehydratase family protein [Caldilineae bacterium]|nr:NAD-dependent epimerase/dehydratase family protein [Anaerolineae bacterium]MCB0203213.1 NAD-dependent epimerase/dehydratase family protein [Anaerolineae bacterium]MCB0255289.1 NAD-dependent epimerase/dehydratase family protein [Anaerolineae bacterium]MCB9153683.1 NAD-dependent epimerase/dehydratase family protein [Caldilineae bacterium]
MRVLVTGGAGFIGSHVVDAYVAAGHEVSVLDNLSTGKLDNLNPATTLYQTDIRDPQGVERAFAVARPEIVCHQAALADVRASMREPEVYAQVNILGSINLLETSRRHSVRKFVYASTGGAAYGEPDFVPVTEAHPVNPLDCYGASKHTVEHYLFIYNHAYGLETVTLRYANVYGPRQDPHGEAGVVAIFTGRMLAGEPCVIHGTGKQQRDFVYVGDVARANLAAATRGSGIYNIGSGVATDINTIFAQLKQAAGYDQDAIYGPAKLGEVFRIYLDTSKAQEALAWQPTMTLEEGLRQTIAYFQAETRENS